MSGRRRSRNLGSSTSECWVSWCPKPETDLLSRLGPEYETPLDPAGIRARASQAAEDRSGGGHRLGGSGSNDRHSPPQTPKKRSHSHRNAASSDEEQPLAGWNSDDDVKLKPFSQHKSRKDAGYLATPDVSPEKKKIKREVLEVDLEPEPNPFLDTSADDEDPFHAVLAAVDKAKKERKKFKAQLKARDVRIKGLEEELERVKQGRRA